MPEGDWYCPVCQQDQLIRNIQAKLDIIDQHYKALEAAKTQSIQKRTNRIADIGANLDNLFGVGSRKRSTKNYYYEGEDQAMSGNEDDGEEGNVSRRRNTLGKNLSAHRNIFKVESSELLGPRSCRVKTKINYTFEEFDRTIKQAVGEPTNNEEGLDEEKG